MMSRIGPCVLQRLLVSESIKTMAANNEQIKGHERGRHGQGAVGGDRSNERTREQHMRKRFISSEDKGLAL